jgi:MATE family multidrug resistance protein
VALYGLFDGLQCVATGALRGAALQLAAAGINVVSYTVVGLPLAWALAIKAGWGLEGIWWGFCCAVLTAFVLAMLALGSVKWDEKARLAREKALTET